MTGGSVDRGHRSASSSSGDALLVVRDESLPFSALEPGTIDEALLARAWRVLELLGVVGIAHRHIDAQSLVLRGGDVGFVDFERATLAPRADQLLTDRAQLLAATAALVGIERALAAAFESLGPEGVAALLPYLQPAAFRSSLRRALDVAGIEVDELRRGAQPMSLASTSQSSSSSGVSRGGASPRRRCSSSRRSRSSGPAAVWTSTSSVPRSRKLRGRGSRSHSSSRSC